MTTVSFGKAKLRIHVEGCTRCGTQFSHAWFDDLQIVVSIDGRKPVTLTAHVCGTCAGVPCPPARAADPTPKPRS